MRVGMMGCVAKRWGCHGGANQSAGIQQLYYRCGERRKIDRWHRVDGRCGRWCAGINRRKGFRLWLRKDRCNCPDERPA